MFFYWDKKNPTKQVHSFPQDIAQLLSDTDSHFFHAFMELYRAHFLSHFPCLSKYAVKSLNILPDTFKPLFRPHPHYVLDFVLLWAVLRFFFSVNLLCFTKQNCFIVFYTCHLLTDIFMEAFSLMKGIQKFCALVKSFIHNT